MTAESMHEDFYDVVVVGAGFAGLTAARELSQRGFKVAVVEGRDRIGGRTWHASRLGRDLELGGTWVHWTQPFVWAELQRYGIGVVASPSPRTAYWWDGQQAYSGDPSRLIELLDVPNLLLTRDAQRHFPAPFDAVHGSDLLPLDLISVAEQIDALDLVPPEREMLRSFWTLNFNGHIDDAALTQALRWIALTNGDWKVNFEACATLKVDGGTGRLVEALAADVNGPIFTGSDVRRVVDGGEMVTIGLADSRRLSADHVIVTAPLHTMERIEFSPVLSRERMMAIERGQIGRGTKIWITLEGEWAPFVALGGADWPLNFFQVEYVQEGRTYVVCFGPDSTAIDAHDMSAIQQTLRRLVPGATVIDSAGHDWVADEYSGETWPMHRTGFLTSSLRALQAPHGRVTFAGSDLANGWGGFIDGAIQSGLEAARSIIRSNTPTSTTIRYPEILAPAEL